MDPERQCGGRGAERGNTKNAEIKRKKRSEAKLDIQGMSEARKYAQEMSPLTNKSRTQLNQGGSAR
jgi:hypothetical protein